MASLYPAVLINHERDTFILYLFSILFISSLLWEMSLAHATRMSAAVATFLSDDVEKGFFPPSYLRFNLKL